METNDGTRRATSATVTCSNCHVPLTVRLALGNADQLDREASDRSPVVPRGLVVVDPEPDRVWKLAGPGTGYRDRSPAGSVVVHPEDLIDDAVWPNANGCCGLDGLDGPNQACARCGQVLGTAQTDCWTAAEIRFLPDAIRIV